MKFDKAYNKLLARECEYIYRKNASIKLVKLDQEGQAVIVSTHNPDNGKYEIHREKWAPSIDDKIATDWAVGKLKLSKRKTTPCLEYLKAWLEITFKF